MAFDAFLKLEGIEGSSTDEKHDKWIEIISFSHAITQPSSPSVSADPGTSSGRCDHEDFQISSYLGKTYPKLALACSNGTPIPTATLELCTADEKKFTYMEYNMEEVIVTSVSPGGTGGQGGDARPTMHVSLAYATIEFKYNSPEGGSIISKWDLKLNKGE